MELSTATKSSIANDRGAVKFPCPECATPITRTSYERANVIRYKCPKCGFEGPN